MPPGVNPIAVNKYIISYILSNVYLSCSPDRCTTLVVRTTRESNTLQL